MSRCEHNQKIIKFCITPNCIHTSSGGCQYCFKRYHCHIGEIKLLKETEVTEILKDLTAFQDKKIKVRPLKQAIYNYFNIIKGQLSSYIDSMSSDLLNRITFPYIKKQGKLNVIKKLKHKEYNKLTTDEMIKLSQFREANPPEKFQASEINSYIYETREVHQKVIAINNLYKLFQKQTEGSYMGQAIMSVGIYYKKIMEIIQHIESQKVNLQERVQESNSKKDNQKQQTEKFSILTKQDTAPKTTYTRKNQVQLKLHSKSKSQDQSKRPSIQTQKPAQKILHEESSNKRQARARRVSIDNRCSDLILYSKLKTYEEKQKQIQERKNKLDEMMNKKNNKSKLSQQSQSSTEKEKTKEIQTTDKINGSNLAESNVKSTKSNELNSEQIVAHTLLPEAKDQKKLYEQFQAVQKKTLKIPVNVIQQNAEGQECQSPILKLKKSERNKSTGFQLGIFKVQQTQQTTQSEDPRSTKTPEVSSQSSSGASDKQNVKPALLNHEEMNVSQKQANSIFLLAQSLKLSAKKAIPLLQAALKYAPHNFSAAQYLSYLFLEQKNPKECLKVCNDALKLISGEPNSIQISFHLFNNKAAALNLLGRFSESIPILQKCIQVKRKDVLYKNLGDAFFNLGIIQKAVINYENATILNDDNHEALYNLAVCLYIQKNFESSKLKVQRALLMDSENDSYIELYKQIGHALHDEKVR